MADMGRRQPSSVAMASLGATNKTGICVVAPRDIGET
jgi:hypothetical protein